MIGRFRGLLERLDSRVLTQRDQPRTRDLEVRPTRSQSPRPTRGPLADLGIFRLVRAVPQVGYVVIAALLLADLAVLGNGLADRRRAGPITAGPLPVPPGPAVSGRPDTGPGQQPVGPTVGQDVGSYIVARQDVLRTASRAAAQAPIAAVVSFSRGIRPSELRAVTSSIPISQVLIHVFVTGRATAAAVVPVSPVDIPTSLGQAIAPAIVALRQQAIDSQHQADTMVVLNANDQAQKVDFVAEARANTLEATALSQGGPFIYAVVVTGTPRILLGLASHRVIRLVDLAPPGLPATAVRSRGIFPEDSGLISELTALRGLSL